MNQLAMMFGILAGIAQLYGYWLYNKAIDKDAVKPNPTSWGLWSFGNIIASWSYLRLIHADPAKGILPFVCAIACLVTFLRAWRNGKFEKPDRESVLIAIVDLEIVAFWLLTESDMHTNLLIQIDAMVSFAPMIRDLWRNPGHEKTKPWFVWCAAYALLFVSVTLSWEKWWDIMYPVNYFFLCLAIALIVKYRTARA